MSWKVRHEGSPQHVEVPGVPEIVEGLQSGQWAPTDEVMDPQSATWVAIENHPKLEEIAADIEPSSPPFHDDETHLDMNALIDVCLVLLIFFILTTSYAALQKILETPEVGADVKKETIRVVDKAEVANLMITVQVR